MRSTPHRSARVLGEPLLHFLILGGALLLLFGDAEAPDTTGDDGAARAPEAAPRMVVVTPDVVAGLARAHEARTGQPVDAATRATLLEGWVEEEILVAEALRLGLAEDDVIVRRRLVQKMQFLAESEAPVTAPDEATLRAQLAAAPERYRRPARVSLEHVFFGAEAGRARALEARAALAAGADPQTLGEPFAHGRRLEALTAAQLDAMLGDGFAAQLDGLEEGPWAGPLTSALGHHLVRVTGRAPAALPPLDQLRSQVTQDVVDARLEAVREAALRALRARYIVVYSAPVAQGAR